MTEKTDILLTKGLLEGYVGNSVRNKIERSGFKGKSSDFSDSAKHYHDEWFADDNGGGQELVIDNEEQATRVYAGGVIPVEELKKLGLSTKDVIQRLVVSVNKLEGKTRLHAPCSLKIDDNWDYDYSILKQPEEVPLTIGYESIKYNGREVFVHGHILSPVK